MTLQDLKTILIDHLGAWSKKPVLVNQEIVDHIIRGRAKTEVLGSEAMVFQVNGTTVFLSDSGLKLPEQIIFVDLKSRESFLQELEQA
ncbi:MAG: hypothetical protein HY582_01715 [Candidatus Omnitrophica bacterium]|nr:hypothetical protein [Candidatus Omnitrophota bacterium]